MQIETLELCAPDLSNLGAFYGDLLGLGAWRDQDGLAITAGTTSLIFREDPRLAGVNHFAFNIPENRIDAANGWLQSRGIELIPGPDGPVHRFQDWNAHSVYFYDPAGNIVELIARHELANGKATNEPFAADEILNVSEIGIACQDVLQTANVWMEEYGLTPYRNLNEGFSTLGDANGLFILVPEGRIWYPETGIPATTLPVKASFAEGRKRHSLAGIGIRRTE